MVLKEQERLTLSVSEAAKLLGISRSHAFELVRRNQMPGAVRLGGRIVVSRAVLEKAINGEAVAP